MILKRLVFFFIACVFALSAEAQSRSHTVESQETVYGISKQYRVSIEDLQKLNPDIIQGLKVGVVLVIPDSKASVNETPSNLKTHLIKEGETLYSLANQYKTSPEELKKANNGLLEGLKSGEEIFIPEPSPVEEVAEQPKDKNFFHNTVKAGETAYSLSKIFKISLDSIYILNPDAKGGLQIGFQLKLPKNREVYSPKKQNPKGGLVSDDSISNSVKDTVKKVAAGKEENFLYQIKVGDSFFSLKQKFGVSKEELIALNSELKDGIELDKYIIIPRAGKDDPVEERNTGWLDRLFNKVDSGGTATVPIILIPRDTSRGKETIESQIASKDLGRSFRISLMLPFTISADSLRRNNAIKAFNKAEGNLDPKLIDSKRFLKPKLERNSIASIEFYNGLMLAMDSLGKLGMPLDVKIFDTRNDKNLVKTFIDSVKTNKPDLVIGPLFKSNVEYVADELMEDDIMVLSPLSRTVSPESRPNLIQCIPGDDATASKIADVINEEFSNANIIFAHTGTSKESRSILAIKGRLLARDDASYMGDVTFTEEMLKRNELAEVIAAKSKNVFVVVSEDKVFLSDLINKLRQLRDTSIYIIASHKVKDIGTLETEYLDKLKLTMTDPNFINYEDTLTMGFIQKYRTNYNTEPSSYSFQGYDIGMLFLRMLWDNKADLSFPLEQDTTYNGLQTKFKFSKESYNGYQNEFLFHTGIRNMTLVKFNKKPIKKATQEEPPLDKMREE